MATFQIIARKEAERLGLKVYFTGEPCRHGHIAERFVKHSWCKECAALRLRPEGEPKAEGSVDWDRDLKPRRGRGRRSRFT